MARSAKEHAATKAKVDQLREESERLAAAKGQHAETSAAAKENVQRATRELKEVSSKDVDVLKNIHPNMPELVAKVGRTRFSGAVVGPLGLYVKLNQGFDHLALAAESALRGQKGLSAFVCEKRADADLLRQLAQGLPPPPRGSSNFHLGTGMPVTFRPVEKRFVVPQGNRMKTEHPTLLDAITISDDKMHNYFVDSYGSGQTLLFATDEEARVAVLVEARPLNAPNKLTGFINDNQTNIYLSFAGGTQGREFVGNKSLGLLMADLAARKGFLEQQLQQRKSELVDVERQARQADDAYKGVVAEEKKQRKELSVCSDRHRKANSGLKELEQTDADEALADLEMAKGDVEREQGKAEQAAAEEEQWRQQQARAQADFQPRKAKFDAAKASYVRAQGATEAQREAGGAVDAPIRQKNLQKRKLEKELVQAAEGGAKKRKEVADITAYLLDMAPRIEEQIGPRVDDPQQRSVDQLKSDYARAVAKLQKAEQKHGGRSLLELEETMVRSMKKLQSRKEELTVCDKTHADLKSSFASRYKHWCREVKSKGKQAAPATYGCSLSSIEHGLLRMTAASPLHMVCRL